MMWGYTNSWWGWLLMTLTMVGFWALLIALIVVLVRRVGPSDRPPEQRRPDPEQLLAERLARGEIDPDEYRQRLQVVREDAARR
jgi:putative membrane protein